MAEKGGGNAVIKTVLYPFDALVSQVIPKLPIPNLPKKVPPKAGKPVEWPSPGVMVGMYGKRILVYDKPGKPLSPTIRSEPTRLERIQGELKEGTPKPQTQETNARDAAKRKAWIEQFEKSRQASRRRP